MQVEKSAHDSSKLHLILILTSSNGIASDKCHLDAYFSSCYIRVRELSWKKFSASSRSESCENLLIWLSSIRQVKEEEEEEEKRAG